MIITKPIFKQLIVTTRDFHLSVERRDWAFCQASKLFLDAILECVNKNVSMASLGQEIVQTLGPRGAIATRQLALTPQIYMTTTSLDSGGDPT